MKDDIVRIMICDDSLLMRKQLKDYIKLNFDCEVLESVNGEEAVDNYKMFKPLLVIMDIVMPVKSGIEALKEIISFDRHANVIMASSIGTQEKLKLAIELGARDFMQKPISFEYVSKMINSCLKGGS